MSDILIVFVTALLSGGFAIPLGFLLEVPGVGIYLASVGGAVVGMILFAFVGSGIRQWMMQRIKDPEKATERVNRLLGTWGIPGLGLVGPIFPGVTISVVLGLALGADRKELVTWMTVGIFGLYALYTLGLFVLIEITGV